MFARCSLVLLLAAQAQGLTVNSGDKVQVERAIDFEEAQIKALEEEIAAESGKPKLQVQKQEEVLEATSGKKEGTTLMVSVSEEDVDQIPLRVPSLLKAQNHKFSGGAWLVYDNNGVKPSENMRKVLDKAMEEKHVDGWLEVDYSPEGIAKLHQKVGMRFAPNTPEGNLAHYYIMDQCETEYCAHYDLDVVSFADDGYSWVDRGVSVLKSHDDIMQVVSSNPPKERHLIDFSKAGDGSLLQTESGAGYTAHSCNQVMHEARLYQGKRFITGRMYLMDKQRYDNLFPITGPACKDSSLRWEEVISCESCRFNKVRATLKESSRGWHLDFKAPAGPQLERALKLVNKGVAVTSKLVPHRAAGMELWDMQADFEALHPSF